MEGRCPTPKESPHPQGPRVGGKGAPLHTQDSSLAPQRTDLALLQSSRVGVRIKGDDTGVMAEHLGSGHVLYQLLWDNVDRAISLPGMGFTET